ncbi:MAG: prolipoprotein diacylglyceryl transferase [Paenibacillaceae bacterium]|nr:prolipoprotein diacylglyceryl transferase [Paenibacillaceae bacterium]
MTAPFDPIALDLSIVTIRWYGILLACAVAMGLWIAVREGARKHIPAHVFIDAAVFSIPMALIGARLYYVSFRWDYYSTHWMEIIAIWQGGIAIYGALIGSAIGVWLFARRRAVSFMSLIDCAAPGFLLGQAIGRWGNFFNQEAYGAAVGRESLSYVPQFIVDQMWIAGQYRQPTFLYESIWCLGCFVLLLVVRRLAFVRPGDIALLYVASYALGRFFIEGLRADSLTFHAPEWMGAVLHALWTPMTLFAQSDSWESGVVRVSQMLALCLFVGSIGLLLWRRWRSVPSEPNRELAEERGG